MEENSDFLKEGMKRWCEFMRKCDERNHPKRKTEMKSVPVETELFGFALVDKTSKKIPTGGGGRLLIYKSRKDAKSKKFANDKIAKVKITLEM